MRDAEFRDRIEAEVRRELGADARQALIRYESIWYSSDARKTTPSKVAHELVAAWRRSPGPTARRANGKKSCGFAIYTDPQSIIEANAEDKAQEFGAVPGLVTKDGKITNAGWDQLTQDINRIEGNALGWLKKKFDGARDDGHSGDELVGSVWYDPTNKDQFELLKMGVKERIDFSDTSYGGFTTALDGVSDFGASVLGGGIVFYDCDEEF